jgi:heptosyltransferase I
MNILVVRLGAMGDVLHTLPAVTGLHWKHKEARIHWVVEPRWQVLLEGNPALASVIPLDRRSWESIKSARDAMRKLALDRAYDFQGLIKSALVTWQSGARERIGYATPHLREPLARLFYGEQRHVRAEHVVDQHLELVQAPAPTVLSLPAGEEEGELLDGPWPAGPFVLACPFAGWRSKQWPNEYFAHLAKRLPVPLVLNAGPQDMKHLNAMPNVYRHMSSIAGLIWITRKAAAVVGVDSGPLHLAAALGRRGVAIFGGTDPKRNGPYGGQFKVLRSAQAVTSYERKEEIDAAMRAVTVDEVYGELAPLLVS